MGMTFTEGSTRRCNKWTASLNEKQIEYTPREHDNCEGEVVEKRSVFEAIQGIRLFWWLTASTLIALLFACWLLGVFEWAQNHPAAFGSTVQATATLAIASFVAYIAWQQHKTASDKLKLDLSDRRYKVYRGCMDFLGEAVREPRIPKEALRTFFAKTHEGRFLFGDDIKGFLVEVREKIGQLRHAQEKIDLFPEGAERDAAINLGNELLSWVDKQIEQAAGKFEKYLAFKTNL